MTPFDRPATRHVVTGVPSRGPTGACETQRRVALVELSLDRAQAALIHPRETAGVAGAAEQVGALRGQARDLALESSAFVVQRRAPGGATEANGVGAAGVPGSSRS